MLDKGLLHNKDYTEEDRKERIHPFKLNVTPVGVPSIGGHINFKCKQPDYFSVTHSYFV